MRATTLSATLMLSAGLAAQAVLLSGTSVTIAPGTEVGVMGNTTLVLQSGSSVVNDGSIVFGPDATLDEQAGAPIAGGGTERSHRLYSSPLNDEEPAGLGFSLTTTTAPDSLLIVRGHVPRVNNTGNAGIARWFEVRTDGGALPGSTATLAYDQTELNGIPEPTLRMASNTDGGAWWPELNSTLDQVNNTATAAVPDSSGWFTLFDDAVITDVPGLISPESDLVLYPTLATERITVSGRSRITECVLLDAAGRIAMTAGANGTTVELDVSHLASGTYAVRINGSATLRFVKP